MVEAIEASGGKFYEASTAERLENAEGRDGSYARPFLSLAHADPRHRSIRLAREGEPLTGHFARARKSLGRISGFDRQVVDLLEARGPMSCAELARELGKMRYLTRRLTLMVRRGLIEHPSWGVYRTARKRGDKETIFEGGSRYVEAPETVERRGIFAGDLLELSAAPLEVGDLVMDAKEYPAVEGRATSQLRSVARVWLKFVVLEGGTLRLKSDLFKVTGVFRMLFPAPTAEEGEANA